MIKKRSQSPSKLPTTSERGATIAAYRRSSAIQLRSDLEKCPKGISKKYLASLTTTERKNVLAGLAFDGGEAGGITIEQSIELLLSLPKRLRDQRKKSAAAMKITAKRLEKHP